MLKTVSNVDFQGKNVLLRVGFDVDIVNNEIVDARRVKAGLPTILHLLEHGASKITVVNHIGRPAGKVDMALSNKPVEKRVKELIEDYDKADGHRLLSKIKFLENIRFDPREEKNARALARELAKNQDVFVQDAFSNCHRAHASMAAIAEFLPSYAGLLVEKEYQNLSQLLSVPAKPFVVIIGGVKVETKVPVIKHIKPLADWVLVGGEIANQAKAERLFEGDEKIVLALDGVEDENGIIRDIGVKTTRLFKEKLGFAKTVFWNGNLGKTEDSRYLRGSREIGIFLGKLDAFTVAGGGDTAALIDELGIADKFDYISTAGGASLVFLAGGKMPGLTPLFS